jgi:hypothetical protein
MGREMTTLSFSELDVVYLCYPHAYAWKEGA